jgi:hypothetical protein
MNVPDLRIFTFSGSDAAGQPTPFTWNDTMASIIVEAVSPAAAPAVAATNGSMLSQAQTWVMTHQMIALFLLVAFLAVIYFMFFD